MKTYEGIMAIKWYKNDNGGDRRPLTIDVENNDMLNSRLKKIKNDFKKDKKNGRLLYSINFLMSERK